jgi:hypothetical protein
MTIHEPTPGMYSGISREQASRKAQEICRIAGETGQTVRAAAHLALLVQIIEQPGT